MLNRLRRAWYFGSLMEIAAALAIAAVIIFLNLRFGFEYVIPALFGHCIYWMTIPMNDTNPILRLITQGVLFGMGISAVIGVIAIMRSMANLSD